MRTASGVTVESLAVDCFAFGARTGGSSRSFTTTVQTPHSGGCGNIWLYFCKSFRNHPLQEFTTLHSRLLKVVVVTCSQSGCVPRSLKSSAANFEPFIRAIGKMRPPTSTAKMTVAACPLSGACP